MSLQKYTIKQHDTQKQWPFTCSNMRSHYCWLRKEVRSHYQACSHARMCVYIIVGKGSHEQREQGKPRKMFPTYLFVLYAHAPLAVHIITLHTARSIRALACCALCIMMWEECRAWSTFSNNSNPSRIKGPLV